MNDLNFLTISRFMKPLKKGPFQAHFDFFQKFKNSIFHLRKKKSFIAFTTQKIPFTKKLSIAVQNLLDCDFKSADFGQGGDQIFDLKLL